MAGCTEKRLLLSLETTKVTLCDDSFGPALMPVAHATLCGPPSSNEVWLPPGVNDGASLTPVTLIVNVCAVEVSLPPFAVPPSSCATTVTVALPNALAAGTKLSTPLGETDGCTAKRAALPFETWKATLWPDSFGPAEIALAHAAAYAPESSLTA